MIVGNCVKFSETTQVTFSQLRKECIAAYVDTGEPLDKAGGYGVSGSWFYICKWGGWRFL